MGFADALSTCFRKSLRFSGRATRSEYWRFLPVGVLLPMLGWWGLWMFTPETNATVRFALCLLLLAPLASVTARRLNDIGADTEDIRPPMAALVAFCVSLILFSWLSNTLEASMQNADGPAVFFTMIAFGPPVLLLLITTTGCFLFGLFTGASLFGQMLISSQPGPNKYGPNPHEVSQ